MGSGFDAAVVVAGDEVVLGLDEIEGAEEEEEEVEAEGVDG